MIREIQIPSAAVAAKRNAHELLRVWFVKSQLALSCDYHMDLGIKKSGDHDDAGEFGCLLGDFGYDLAGLIAQRSGGEQKVIAQRIRAFVNRALIRHRHLIGAMSYRNQRAKLRRHRQRELPIPVEVSVAHEGQEVIRIWWVRGVDGIGLAKTINMESNNPDAYGKLFVLLIEAIVRGFCEVHLEVEEDYAFERVFEMFSHNIDKSELGYRPNRCSCTHH